MLRAVAAAFALTLAWLGPWGDGARADDVVCNNGPLARQAIRLGGSADEASQPDLLVKGPCRVLPGTYSFGNINILDGGVLTFEEQPNGRTQLWASAIIVENGGAITAGSAASPFGEQGGALTISLYGADHGAGDTARSDRGAPCRTPVDRLHDVGPCGIPLSVWENQNPVAIMRLPGGVAGQFLPYEPLSGDEAAGAAVGASAPGYFGDKVLAVSYGGMLALFGAKGVESGAADDEDRAAPGLGWVRLAEGSSLDEGAVQLTLDRPVQGNWMPGDEAALTATDGQPDHVEDLTIDSVNGATITFHRAECGADAGATQCPGLRWPHRAVTQSADTGSDSAQPVRQTDAPSGAAVALLTRSIAIIGAGNVPGQSFDGAAATDPRYTFGGHTIVRRGFRAWQVQGVQFKRLGQDNTRDRTPINFYVVGTMPPGAFVKDSVVWDTMTRWYQPRTMTGVTLERVTAYRAISRSYYLAECTFAAAYVYCEP